MNRKWTTVILWMAIYSLVLSDYSFAQQKPDSLQVHLKPVEVQASRFGNTPETMSLADVGVVRTTADLNNNPDITLDRLSYTIPGLWINNRENYSLGERITMRGIGWRSAFGVRGIQILLDGIPLTTADGQSMTGIIDPSFIRNIEVIRGPASSFWGNSSGGVIDLSTIPSDIPKYHIRFREIAGSFGLNKTDLELDEHFGKNIFQAYTSYLNQKGFRNHSRVHLSRSGFNGKIPINARSGFTIVGAYQAMPLALNPGALTLVQTMNDPSQANTRYVSYDARKNVYQGQLGIQYHNYTNIGILRMQLYGLFRNLKNPLTYAYIKLNRLAGGGRITLQNENRWFKWNIGYEGKWQHDNRVNWENNNGIPVPGDSLAIDQLEQVFNHALFGGISIPLSDWTISSGLRLDHLVFKADDHIHQTNLLNNESGRRMFNALSPTFGISYKSGNARIYANVSTAFEAPTTTELVNRPGGGGGFNPDIKPEHTISFEIGINGNLSKQNIRYDVSVFDMKVRDMLMPFEDSSGRTYYRNAGKTRHLGFEAYLDWSPIRNVHATLMYSMLHATFLNYFSSGTASDTGNDIPGVPRRRLNGQISWDLKPFQLSTDMEIAGKYFVNNNNTEYNRAYTTLNARLSTINLQMGKGLIIVPFISVNNITDTRYNSSVIVNAYGSRYFEPAPGINWKAGFTVQY